MNAELSAAAVVERTILGACLLENEAGTELLLSILQAHHLELDSHRRIFETVRALHMSQQPVSMLTLCESLRAAKQLEAVGGSAYAFSLTEGLPRGMGEVSLRNYAERVKEYWRLRELQRAGAIMQAEAEDGSIPAASVLQGASERMEAIVDDADEEEAGVGAHIVGFMDRFYANRKLDRSPGLSYGLPDLDAQTGGMMPGEQTAVGAVSGVGKTAFMAQCILGTLAAGHAVDAFLLEPTKDQITARLLSLITGVRYKHIIKSWFANKSEEQIVAQGASQLAEMPFRMFGRSSITLDEVLGHARLGMRKYGTRLVCLDYIQRLKIRQTEREEPIRLRVGRASTALADLVKNTQTHSLVLSQITTGRKSGAQSLPTMFDFRESSQIENDAHTIILLHREYDEQQGHYTNNGAIFVPKQRNGTPCNLKASFDEVTAAWSDKPLPQMAAADYPDRRNYL